MRLLKVTSQNIEAELFAVALHHRGGTVLASAVPALSKSVAQSPSTVKPIELLQPSLPAFLSRIQAAKAYLSVKWELLCVHG